MTPLCAHCQTSVPQGLQLKSRHAPNARFCCVGCLAVYDLIADSGMSDLYHRSLSDGEGAPPPSLKNHAQYEFLSALQSSPPSSSSARSAQHQQACTLSVADEFSDWEDEERVKRLIKESVDERDGESFVVWDSLIRIEGMTCSACAWINEHALQKLGGIVSAHVNMVTRTLFIRFRPQHINLAQILTAIAGLGYRPRAQNPEYEGWEEGRNEGESGKDGEKTESRRLMWKLFVAGFSTMQAMSFSVPLYFADVQGTSSGAGLGGADINDLDAALLRWTTLLIATPAILYAGWDYFSKAWREGWRGRVGMELPIALGLGIGLIHSVWIGIFGGGDIYFDSMTMLLFFLLCGRYVDNTIQWKVRQALWGERQTRPTQVWRWEQGQGMVSALNTIRVGDAVLVKHGDTIPLDGVFIGLAHSPSPSSSENTAPNDHQAAINESLLTGESQAVVKNIGEAVHASSINLGAPLLIKVSALGRGRLRQEIEWMVAKALSAKPRFISSAQLLARYFIVALLILVAATLSYWVPTSGWDEAIKITVALLVVTCPCALALAAPLTLSTLMAQCLRKGILLQNVAVLENCHRTSHIVVDKTGTLTEGQLRLTQLVLLPRDESMVPPHANTKDMAWNTATALAIARALEATSEHPLAAAIMNAPPIDGTPSHPLPNINILHTQILPHAGVDAQLEINGERSRWRIGASTCCQLSEDKVQLLINAHHHQMQADGKSPNPLSTWVFLVQCPDDEAPNNHQTRRAAMLVLEDQLRAQACEVIGDWQARGIAVSVVSGDRAEAVQAMAKSINLPPNRAHAEHTPAMKAQFVRHAHQQGDVVMMIGDGVNDAPVLALADVSVGMPNASDVSKWAADIVLLPGARVWARLSQLLPTLHFARKLLMANYFWALLYNLVMIPLAMMGWVNPWVAGLGMTLSSLLVMMNSLRLLGYRNH